MISGQIISDHVPDQLMITAVKYHFDKVEKEPSIIILDDFQYLKGVKLIKYIDFIEATKPALNFCLITTEKFMDKHLARSNNNATSKEISDLIVDWRSLEKVSFEEKCQVCFIFGLRDQRLIDRLAKESGNLKDLYKMLRRIKRIAKSRTNS